MKKSKLKYPFKYDRTSCKHPRIIHLLNGLYKCLSCGRVLTGSRSQKIYAICKRCGYGFETNFICCNSVCFSCGSVGSFVVGERCVRK